MPGSLVYSLLELAHATSQNLAFAHLPGVEVSYGEETITETNLLELRRRHPLQITLRTFSKKQEASNGADWEWHIRGRAREFRMRVQAKRLQRDNRLKVLHTAASTGQQLDLLIADSKRHGRKPVYCFYSTEKQRDKWHKDKRPAIESLAPFEYGCLLASAHHVKKELPRILKSFERHCIPWHYLAERRSHFYRSVSFDRSFDTKTGRFSSFFDLSETVSPFITDPEHHDLQPEFPTIDELNDQVIPPLNLEGVVESTSPDYGRDPDPGEYRERRISRLLEIDVRGVGRESHPK